MDLPDAQKKAQNVGQQFVDQYYTTLQEDPGFLHRLRTVLL
jgi:hypothetical protein